MQEFLTNNTVSCNLMSLTGYRTLVILQALLESPKTIDEINECLLNNQYIKEKFSFDTLRIYLNSLRKIGCEITRANKSNGKKYILNSHPFEYEISKSQLKSLEKLYKNIQEELDIKDVLAIESLIHELSKYVKNKNIIDFLEGLSLLRRVNQSILDDLLIHCKNKNQITIMYNSPKSGEKQIEIIADKLSFKSEKLYLWGNNLTHKEYSFFPVERIIRISGIKLIKSKEKFLPYRATYEIYDFGVDFKLEQGEKIIQKQKEKLTIEVEVQNEFSIVQKILYFGNNCKIIKPKSLKNKLISKLKSMEKIYEES